MAKRSGTEDRLHAIRFLAAWAPTLKTRDKAGCGVLKQLIEAAGREGDRAKKQFEATILRSSKALAPLGEPFAELDFVKHRWVAEHREEAFSDWLQWIIATLDPSDVLSVFGMTEPDLKSSCGGAAVTVEREQRVLGGHEGSTGRLDLKIWFGIERAPTAPVLRASDKAVKAIRAEIRSWKLHLRSDKSIEDLSRDVQPDHSRVVPVLRSRRCIRRCGNWIDRWARWYRAWLVDGIEQMSAARKNAGVITVAVCNRTRCIRVPAGEYC